MKEVVSHLRGVGEVTISVEVNAIAEKFGDRIVRVVREKRHSTRFQVPRIREVVLVELRRA